MLWRLAKLICRSARLRIATLCLCLEERAEQRGPPILEVAFPLESALQQSLDSLLRFRPRQRGLKRVEGVEEPVGGWQRDLINEILRRRDGAPIEGSDPPRDHAASAAHLPFPNSPVTVSHSFPLAPAESL